MLRQHIGHVTETTRTTAIAAHPRVYTVALSMEKKNFCSLTESKCRVVRHPMDTEALIPFDEIVPGAKVRVAVINGKQYLSVRDLIMHLCNKDNNAYL